MGILGRKQKVNQNKTLPYTIRVRNSHCLLSQNYIADPSIKTKDPTAMTAGTLPPAMVPAAPVWVGAEVGDPESLAVGLTLALELATELEGVGVLLLLLMGVEEELVIALELTVVVAVARTTVLVIVSVEVETIVSASAS